MDFNFKQCLDLVTDKFSVLTLFADKVPAGDILCGLFLIDASDRMKHDWFTSYIASLDPRHRLTSAVFEGHERTDSSDLLLFLAADYSPFFMSCTLHDYEIAIARAEFEELSHGATDILTPYADLHSSIVVTSNAAITDTPVSDYDQEDDETPIVNTIRLDMTLPLSQQLTQFVECDADVLQTFAAKNILQCRECSDILNRAGVRVWFAK